MGLFNPQIADQALAVVSMMDFDRRDEVMQKITENGTMYQKLQQMYQLILQLAEMVSDFSGRQDLLMAVQNIMGTGPAMTAVDVNPKKKITTNSLGEMINNDGSMAGQARARTATSTEVR